MNTVARTNPNPMAEDRRALLAERLRNAIQRVSSTPMSYAQQRLWFLDQLEPNSALYNIPTLIRLKGTLDLEALQSALTQIVSRHESLRTRFVWTEEGPTQIVDKVQETKDGSLDPQNPGTLRLMSLASVAEGKMPEELERLVHEEINRPFDLSKGPLLRTTLVSLGEFDHALIVVMHHIISDEWSLQVFFRELKALYEEKSQGIPSQLPALPIQYGDYSAWQRQQVGRGSFAGQLEFWREQLRNLPSALELPMDKPRPAVPTFRGGASRRKVSSDLIGQIRGYAERRNVTLYMFFLASFEAVLGRYANREDFVVASPIAGRTRAETADMVGFFVNTLPLRANLSGDPKFETLLQRVRKTTLDAFANQDLPFDKVVEELHPARSLSHLPFTTVMFAIQNGSLDSFTLPGMEAEFVPVATDTSKFDLTLVVQDTREGVILHAEYNTDLFTGQTIERFLGHCEVLMAAAVRNDQQILSRLPLLSATEKETILGEWNRTQTDYPRTKSIQEVFEQQVAERPEAIALNFPQKTLTYRELNTQANQLARKLVAAGVTTDTPVGVCLPRSPEMIIAVLAVLKAGGAYVPLDAAYPQERLQFMLKDTQPPLVLTSGELAGKLPARSGTRTLFLDKAWDSIAAESGANLENKGNAENLAYIMYTSGSTGAPKGVSVTHRGITRLVLKSNYISLDHTDRIAQVSAFSFDAATFEIWGALLNGGQLVGISSDVALSPLDFAEELKKQNITAMFLTAALFNQVAAQVPDAFSRMRTLIAGGEALDPKWVRAVLKAGPPKNLLNGYGPTENTTFTCCELIRSVPEETTNVPIGKPISNTQVYIVDAQMNPVPVGVPGDLYTGGDGLARGYWKRPELTREKFVSNPFAADWGGSPLIYKTGDLARFLSDGRVEFLGRNDNQVKIRGFRIELGEIEAAMGKHSAIKECAVVVRGNSSEEKKIIAYYVSSKRPAPGTNELQKFLQHKLPPFMVPAAFVKLEAFPLTSNGKLDRAALPNPDGERPQQEKRYAGPTDDIEARLVEIWERILAVRPVGIKDRFFDLGGHSLLAVKVIAEIEKTFGQKLRVGMVFQYPTVEQLAILLREKRTERNPGSSLVEIQARGSRKPLFLVHGAGGGMFWGYVNLARHLGQDQPIYGFRADESVAGAITIEGIAAKYIADMRKVQPSGPYYLGGYCFGGNVAYEIARQLTEQGQEIALLALMNCAPPNSDYMKAAFSPVWALRFARNLGYWAGYISSWSAQQRKDFIRWKLARGRKWVKAIANGLNKSAMDVGHMVDLESFTLEEKHLWQQHIQALINYHPRPYPGKVHLFRSHGHPLWCSYAPDYGWKKLAQCGVVIKVVAGAHEKILEEPCAAMLAKEVAAFLPKQDADAVLSIARNGKAEEGLPAGDRVPKSKNDAMEYWKSEVSAAPPLVDIPADHPRPAIQTGAMQTVAATLTAEQTIAIEKTFTEEGRGNPLLTHLAAASTLLKRHGRQEIVVIATRSGSLPGGAGLNGKSDVLLPLVADLSKNPSLADLIIQLRERSENAIRQMPESLESLVRQLYPGADESYHPLCQVQFKLETGPVGTLERKESLPAPGRCFDLIFIVRKNLSGLMELALTFATDLFELKTAQMIVERWSTLLDSIARQPSQKVNELSLLPQKEEKLLAQWNNTARPFPADKTLADLFEAQTEKTPDRVAVICGDRRITYRQLRERSDSVMAALSRHGIQRESLVGVCCERTWEMVAAILGVLKAGAAYVPMDPAYPRDRLAYMIDDSVAAVILTQQKLRATLPSGKAAILCLEDIGTEASTAPPAFLGRKSHSEDLAYVIYTSGSTGKPKGVALEHRNAVAFCHWAREIFTDEQLSGLLFATSICFDLSIFEMFVPLSWGGTLIIAQNAVMISSLPALKEIRLINTVPSAIRELLRLGAVPDSVEVINLAGEPLATATVDQIYSKTAVKKVYDLYGPTETTTYSTYTLREAGKRATIGRPLANEEVLLLDNARQLTPIGVAGEIYIGGAGVARGYLHNPEMTRERFVEHPFRSGARLYKTGDLARWLPDGDLEYIGRIDHQVKIRGFRIELGEVENAVKRVAGVKDAVVMAREDQPGDKRLAAYVIPSGKGKVSADAIKQHLRLTLPEYMIPAGFLVLEKFPLTPNGKIDRKALPQPSYDTVVGLRIAPRTDNERLLAEIWKEVLGVREVGVEDNFFDLGGHSLLAIQVASRVREAFKVEMPHFAVFETSTISALAEALENARWPKKTAELSAIIPMARNGKLPASSVQERLWFIEQLDPNTAAYNVPAALRLKGNLDVDALGSALAKVVSRHEALRTTFAFDYSDGSLTQVINNDARVELKVIDMEGDEASSREAKAVDWVNSEGRRPFELTRGPLVRAALARLQADEYALVVVMHHAIVDGWSLGIFLQELEHYYRLISQHKNGELQPLAVQYVDYAAWQRSAFQQSAANDHLAYWKKKLAGAPLDTDLPLDAVDTSDDIHMAGQRALGLDAELVAGLKKLAHEHAATLFMVLMNAFKIALFKWTGQTDLVVGTVVAGRNRREFEKVIGCFMNFLALRTKLEGTEPALRLLERVKQTVIEGQTHQDCPYEKVVEAVNPERRLAQNPLYNVGFLWQNFPGALFPSDTIEARPMAISTGAALLDLRFEAEEVDNEIRLLCEFRSKVFKESTIEQFLESFRRTLETFVSDPATRVADFCLTPALAEQSRAARAGTAKATIAIAATFTAEPIEDALNYWLGELEIPARLEFAPYNQIFQQLLDPSSVFATNGRGLNLILLRTEDWLSKDQADESSMALAARNASEFVTALKGAASRAAVPYLVCICPDSPEMVANEKMGRDLRELENQLKSQIETIPGVYVATADEISGLYPVADYHDAASNELGHVPYTPLYFTALATFVARRFHALNRSPLKVIVLDCDNTIWSGVCGEDGARGVRLDPPRRALQEFMRAQHEAGVLLCLGSKNNEEDVREVFRQRLEFPLRREHFAAWRLNWRPKSENIKSLARELKLGLDSFLFVDDNPVEIAEVEANCPEVLTLLLPESAEAIPNFLNHCWVFDHLKLTREDRKRSELYRQNQQREQLRSQSMNLGDFISGLDMKITIEPMKPDQIERAAQLTQRTNQFNFTTRRRTEAEMRQLPAGTEILTVTVKDRFGDYGLTGLVIFRQDQSALDVDTFLLSCRVLGRGVEHQVLSYLGELALARRLSRVDAHFFNSAKNRPAKDFLESVGSPFRQALDGGFLFRFPAGFASEVTFNPQVLEDSPENKTASSGEQSVTHHAQKFSKCRAIALQANGAEAIHERVEQKESVRENLKGVYAAPRNDIESKLCEIWQRLLRVSQVGINDNFFQLGGHSLLAVRLFAEIEKWTGRKLPLLTLFQTPTVEQLGRVIAQGENQPVRSVLVPVSPRGSRPPLFLVHGAGGDVLWGYANLAAHMPADQPIYGIRSRGQAGLEEFTHLEDMASYYVREIKAFQPAGPYYLGGYCFGGNVAYEMARQLVANGEEVALVALLDTAPSNAGYEKLAWWNPRFPFRFARNFSYWLGDFAELPSHDRKRFFERKGRALLKKLRRAIGRSNGTAHVDLEDVIDPALFPEHELKLWQAHLQGLVEHVQQPYPGDVVLFRTKGQPLLCSLEEDFCWRKLVRGKLEVKLIPGSHENIFMEPHVQDLARSLAARIAGSGTEHKSEKQNIIP